MYIPQLAGRTLNASNTPSSGPEAALSNQTFQWGPDTISALIFGTVSIIVAVIALWQGRRISNAFRDTIEGVGSQLGPQNNPSLEMQNIPHIESLEDGQLEGQGDGQVP